MSDWDTVDHGMRGDVQLPCLSNKGYCERNAALNISKSLLLTCNAEQLYTPKMQAIPTCSWQYILAIVLPLGHLKWLL